MFVVEDEIHAEQLGKFSSFEAAISELRRFAAIAWDQHPNLAPCTSWQTCGREYEIIEYDTLSTPWIELRRVRVLNVSANRIEWLLP
jgi:hypothetical protein